jgi:hypothetical protein
LKKKLKKIKKSAITDIELIGLIIAVMYSISFIGKKEKKVMGVSLR